MNPKLTLTVEEAAKMLGVSRGSAYEAARTGELPAIRIGRRLVVPRARLLALLGAPSPEPEPTPSVRPRPTQDSAAAPLRTRAPRRSRGP